MASGVPACCPASSTMQKLHVAHAGAAAARCPALAAAGMGGDQYDIARRRLLANPHVRQLSGGFGQANFFDDMSLCPTWNAQTLQGELMPWLPPMPAFTPACDTLYELALTAGDMMKKIDFIPRTDILYDEQNKEMVLLADVPGYDKSNISVAEEDGTLVIKGELTKEDEADERLPHSRCLMKERRTGYFVRRFQLPKNADHNNINATMDKGLLKVIIKLQDSGPAKKAISIK